MKTFRFHQIPCILLKILECLQNHTIFPFHIQTDFIMRDSSICLVINRIAQVWRFFRHNLRVIQPIRWFRFLIRFACQCMHRPKFKFQKLWPNFQILKSRLMKTWLSMRTITACTMMILKRIEKMSRFRIKNWFLGRLIRQKIVRWCCVFAMNSGILHICRFWWKFSLQFQRLKMFQSPEMFQEFLIIRSKMSQSKFSESVHQNIQWW